MTDSKLSVGNAEIFSILDSEVDYPFPLSQIFPGVSAEAWTAYEERYPRMFGGPDKFRTCWSSYLIRSQGRTILVDTGAGHGPDEPNLPAMFGGVRGHLLQELGKIGVQPEDIDTVFFTHLHPDHVGWNLTREAGGAVRPTFPRARYLAHQADWDYFRNPEVQAHIPFAYVKETIEPLEELGVLELLTGERSLNNEITAIPSPGHTPGHMSLLVSSGGERAVITGDVALHPAQVSEVDWGHIFESDQKQAAHTRTKLFDQWEREDTTLAMCHFPSPGFGKLVRVQGRRYWQGI